MLIPTAPRQNLTFRRRVLAEAAGSGAFQRGLIERCRLDFAFFVDLFAWQFNPLKNGNEVGPFILWDCQRRAVFKEPGKPWPGEDPEDLGDAGIMWCIDNGRSLLIQKSREMGMSWLNLLCFVWRFWFRPNQKFLCISRNQAAVEDADPDSLFWKVDFLIDHLPNWLVPKGKLKRRQNFFGNKANGSTITGTASTGLAGVGGRATAILIDEFSVIREDKMVREKTVSTSNCRIFNGTHQGMDTEFYALAQDTEIFKLTIHWTQHPEKVAGLYRSGQPIEVIDRTFEYPTAFDFVMDGSPVGGIRPGIRSPWYDRKCREIGSQRGVAMELDVNPSGSVSQFFEPLVIHDLMRHYATDPRWEGEMTPDGNLAYKLDGPLRLWLQLDVMDRPPPARYGGGADIAMGTGASLSCLTLGNADTGEKVLEFASAHISPDDFAMLCSKLFKLFRDGAGNEPLFAWENRGPGMIFTKRLKELGCRNFYYRSNELNVTGSYRELGEPGWDPSPPAKLSLMNDYRQALKTGQFLNRSRASLVDTLAWKYSKHGYPVHGRDRDGDDPSGSRDNHGDLTIADALCWKMMRQLGVSEAKPPEDVLPIGSVLWRRQFHEQQAHRQKGWVS